MPNSKNKGPESAIKFYLKKPSEINKYISKPSSLLKDLQTTINTFKDSMLSKENQENLKNLTSYKRLEKINKYLDKSKEILKYAINAVSVIDSCGTMKYIMDNYQNLSPTQIRDYWLSLKNSSELSTLSISIKVIQKSFEFTSSTLEKVILLRDLENKLKNPSLSESQRTDLEKELNIYKSMIKSLKMMSNICKTFYGILNKIQSIPFDLVISSLPVIIQILADIKHNTFSLTKTFEEILKNLTRHTEDIFLNAEETGRANKLLFIKTTDSLNALNQAFRLFGEGTQADQELNQRKPIAELEKILLKTVHTLDNLKKTNSPNTKVLRQKLEKKIKFLEDKIATTNKHVTKKNKNI